MGSCCCSSRNPQLNGTSVYYYYPSILEEQESLASPDSVTTILDRGLMVDPDLNMSTPDTYRSPPAPIPYDVVLGHPQATYPETLRENINETDYRNSPTCRKFEDSDYGIEKDNVIASPKKLSELLKLDDLDVKTMEEEDVCPTCLEEYDAENPKIITKCNHHYHLSCILEWMERSDTCPICNQEMDFEAT